MEIATAIFWELNIKQGPELHFGLRLRTEG